MRAAAADRVGWACLLALGLLAAGGAASAPGAVLIGIPSPASAAGVTLVVAAAAWLAPRGGRLGLGAVPWLLCPPLSPWLPGAGAWSGAPLFAPFAGVLLLAVAAAAKRAPPRGALLPLLFAAYAVAAARVQVQVGPEGDEPHYLMVAESLLRDGDLGLERDYREGRYRAFSQEGELAPHYRVRGKDGEIYSLHAVGLSLVILPGYAFGGYPGASFLMALLLAWLVRELRLLVSLWVEDGPVADSTALLVGLSPPLVHYAGLLFTEVPAGLLLALALRRLAGEPTRRDLSVAGLCLAFLPWLNVRYAALSVLALGYAAARRPKLRDLGVPLALALASAAGLAAYHQAIYGFLDPRRVYGPRPEFALGRLAEGLPGLLLDQEFGLLAYAPLFALAVPGLAALLRRRPSAGLAALVLVVATLLTAGSWHMWRGGFNPPSRFLVPIVPLLAAGVAAATARGWAAAPALLAGWGLWTGLVGAAEPGLVHRDRQGAAPLFRVHSGAEDWTRLLPRYVLEEPDRHRLLLVWAVGLAAAAAAARRPARARDVAAAALVSVAASGLAFALSQPQAKARDAVRLVGQRALEWPSLQLHAAAPGVWRTTGLPWGPAYEPHRHPGGAPLGAGLPLRAGSYRLGLDAEALGPEAPTVAWYDDERPGRGGRVQARPRAGGFEARLSIPPGSRSWTLRLHGGSPLILRELRLVDSTLPR